MNKTIIVIGVIASIALVIGIIALVADRTVVLDETGKLAGETHFSGPLDTTEGYKVDDTIVIDADGNVDGSITSDTGTFSSTLTVSGILTGSSDVITGDLIEGGGVYATTSLTAGIFTAANVCDYNMWKITPVTGDISFTLPATTTLYADCLTSAGMSKEIMIWNATTSGISSAMTIAVPAAAGTGYGVGGGLDLQATSTDPVIIHAGGTAVLKFWRMDDATTTVSSKLGVNTE